MGGRDSLVKPMPLAFSVPLIRTSSRRGPGGPARLGAARSAGLLARQGARL